MMERTISAKLIELSQKFPVISVVGPRQSGKTTLVKAKFPHYDYVNLENPETLQFALNDPRRFLDNHPSGIIIDEAQKAPDLFSYIQTIVDETQKAGQFILTGSSHFLLMENITQSLAGRVALLTLLPLSISGLSNHFVSMSVDEMLYRGFYPRIYDMDIQPTDWYSNYVQTVIERDIRQLKNIGNLDLFYRFVQLCAGRIGQLVNYSSIGKELGISTNTIRSWFSILQTTFIVFFLRPYYKNFNKRLVKMPKLYFHDIGLAYFLLGVENENQVKTHYLRGELFENLVISELLKHQFNYGKRNNLYFWRDSNGREVDCIMESGPDTLIPIEIKSAATIRSDFFKNLVYWQNLTRISHEQSFLIYGGNEKQNRSKGIVLPWNSINEIWEWEE